MMRDESDYRMTILRLYDEFSSEPSRKTSNSKLESLRVITIYDFY